MKRIGKRLTVLDFDGTCTNAEVEGIGFVNAVITELVRITGSNEARIRAAYEGVEERILRNPEQHGWAVNGIIVAPATVDPYLRSKPIVREILETHGMTRSEIDRIVDELNGPRYNEFYQKSGVCLRPKLGDALMRLAAEPDHAVVIITNAGIEAVKRKLATLTGVDATMIESIPVMGGAKKFIVGDLPNAQSELRIPGLNRPVFCNRPFYFNALNHARTMAGVDDWQNVTVVGDIFELDLALPHALGCKTGLAANSHTPRYEKTFMFECLYGDVLFHMEQIAAFALER